MIGVLIIMVVWLFIFVLCNVICKFIFCFFVWRVFFYSLVYVEIEVNDFFIRDFIGLVLKVCNRFWILIDKIFFILLLIFLVV